MRGEGDDWVTRVASGIHAAIVEKAAASDVTGPFTLDDFLSAWLNQQTTTVMLLPDPPGSPDASMSARRSYWFYEGCNALEDGGWIAEVGDGKFAVASLTRFVAEWREEMSEQVSQD